MLRSGTVIFLHELKGEGKKIRQISRDTGHARNTIRKYLRAKGVPERKTAPPRPSKLDPFKPYLQELFTQGVFNCEVLFQRLQERGYTGGKTILKDYVKEYRPTRQKPAVIRYETKPGEQAQMDWGICEYVDTRGQVHKISVFVMILGYSRVRYVEFAKRCDVYSLIRCMTNAFEFFGGVPKRILTDQMKTVILGRDEAKKPKWHPLFEDFAATMGFAPKVCRVRRPQTKGKVERSIYLVKDNFLPGRNFVDVQDLNLQARQWCHEINHRVHSTTGMRPSESLKNEELQPIPMRDKWAKFRFETRRVSRDGFVSFDGVNYGVPWFYSYRDVQVREVNGVIEIWRDQQRVAHHEKVGTSKAVVPFPDQYKGLKLANAQIAPKGRAIQIPATKVEQRPLEVYARIGGTTG